MILQPSEVRQEKQVKCKRIIIDISTRLLYWIEMIQINKTPPHGLGVLKQDKMK